MRVHFDSRHPAFVTAALTGALFLAAARPTAAQSGSPADGASATILDSVYTAEQAERGRRLFVRDCSSCHAPAQFGDGTLLRSWAGVSVYDLLERIRTTMPYDSPGQLSRQQYADLIAYFLESSGLPAGPEPLRAAAARGIRIVDPAAREPTNRPERP